LKIAIRIALHSSFGLGCSLSAHAVTKLNDDARGETLPYSWGFRNQRLVTIDECAAKEIRPMRREQGDRDLWTNATHIKQGGEESRLIACREANERLGIFSDDVV